MTSHDTTDDAEPTTGTESSHGRRRFVRLSGSAIAVGLAGCSDLGSGSDDDDGTPEGTTDGDATETDQPTETVEPTETESPTDTDEGTATETDESTETDGDIHEHGTLYLEIDGDRHEFTDPKYRQSGSDPGGAADSVFHFHDDGNPYYWHMHDVRLTLTEALESLPDIAIETEDGSPVFDFEGETYVHGEDGVEIEVRQRDVAIDPEEYELQDGDIIWIEVFTDGNDA